MQRKFDIDRFKSVILFLLQHVSKSLSLLPFQLLFEDFRNNCNGKILC